MIVIEGMDGSGKTTLAKRLSKDLNIPRTYSVSPPENHKEFLNRCMKSAILFNKPIIQDRIPFISEIIYAQIENRDPYLSEKTALNILRLNSPLLIYCQSTYIHHVIKNYDIKKRLELIKQNWLKLQSDYDTFMAKLQTIQYNWAAKKLEPLIYDKILKLGKRKLKLIGFLQDNQ